MELLSNRARIGSDVVMVDGEEELAVVAATTKIETRKLSEWQG